MTYFPNVDKTIVHKEHIAHINQSPFVFGCATFMVHYCVLLIDDYQPCFCFFPVLLPRHIEQSSAWRLWTNCSEKFSFSYVCTVYKVFVKATTTAASEECAPFTAVCIQTSLRAFQNSRSARTYKSPAFFVLECQFWGYIIWYQLELWATA